MTAAIIEVSEALAAWLRHGERGLSSNCMVDHLLGLPLLEGFWGMPHPHDPADLRRCLLLLEAVPEVRDRFPEMRTASPEWARLVERWGELVALFKTEAGPGGRWRELEWSAPRTYRLMCEILDEED